MNVFRSKIAAALIAAGFLSPGAVLAKTPSVAAAQALSFGKCIVKADRLAAISLFQQLPADSTSADIGAKMLGKGAQCRSGGEILSSMQVRGSIAEALFTKDFASAGLSPRQPLDRLAQLGLPDDQADGTGVFTVGRCVAKARFSTMEKLFTYPADSRREAEFINGLMPYFAACQPKGAQFSIKRSDIRSLMAQSTYDANVRYWARKSTNGMEWK